MTDRELLEMAARAAEYQVDQRASFATWRESSRLALLNPQGGHTLWNAAEDDGDALRLAVKLGMSLHSFPDHHQGAQSVVTMTRHAVEAREYAESCADDLNAATRRAIVRAAAAIGSKHE